MDDKNVFASFGFLNEIFILNETEKLERIYLPTIAFKEDTNMFSLNLIVSVIIIDVALRMVLI